MEKDEIQRQQDAAQIAHRPAVGRNSVALVGRSNLGRNARTDDGRAETQVGNDKERAAERVIGAVEKRDLAEKAPMQAKIPMSRFLRWV